MRHIRWANQTLSSVQLITIMILWLVIALLFLPILHIWHTQSDFGAHQQVIERLANGDWSFFQEIPHFLYHISVVSVAALPGISLDRAPLIVGLLAYLVLGSLIYGWLRATVQRQQWPEEGLSWPAEIIWSAAGVSMTALLLLVAPINFLTPDNLYLGYHPPHVYHSATMMVLKPTALALFIVSLRTFQRFKSPDWKEIAGFATLTVLCLLAKPHFLMSFIPAIGIIALLQAARNLAPRWRLFILGMFVPAGLVLLYQFGIWQMSSFYQDLIPGTDSTLRVQPFRTYFEWTLHYNEAADQLVIPKLLLSIAFPLVVMIGRPWQGLRWLPLRLAWLNFVIAVAYAWLLVDASDIAAGNFTWSAQVGALILFVTSVAFLLRDTRQWPVRAYRRGYLAIVSAVFALHIAAGLYWYRVHYLHDALDVLYNFW